MKANFRSSLRLLDWYTLARAPLVYASLAANYRGGAVGFVDDRSVTGLRRLKPFNLYGWSKHMFDLVIADRIVRSHCGSPSPPFPA